MEQLRPINSVINLLQFVSIIFLLLPTWWSLVGSSSRTQELLKGFTATPDTSVSSFQSLLTDSTGNYSFGFLRVDGTLLALAVLHVPTSEQLWRAKTTRLVKWSDHTKLLFKGNLVLADQNLRVFWSTNTDGGDRVCLSNTSNLQIQKLNNGSPTIEWQSFDFPSDTLMENQNFTSSMSLVSSNGIYMMRLGSNFMGLYANFKKGSGSGQIYWKHTALEVKANIIEGRPIHAFINSNGYLGMYQNASAPVDVQAFTTFQQPVSGIRRVRLEPDGNLKGYYWTGSSWLLDYQAISRPCELPSSCGSYGLCQPGKGCSCLDNRTDYNSGKCSSLEISNSDDFCGVGQDKYWVLRRNGVELPNKELMGYQKMESLEQCESACHVNCTCWGVLYSNTSGFCYMLDYPIQTLVVLEDETKFGYFKVREGAGKNRMEIQLKVVIGLLFGTVLLFVGILALACYRNKKRKRGVSKYLEEDGVGPYKNLGSASFKSIQLCER